MRATLVRHLETALCIVGVIAGSVITLAVVVAFADASPVRVSAASAHHVRVAHELRRLQDVNDRLHRVVERQRAVLRHRPSVREAIALAAVTFGVPRWQLAAVAWRESRLRPGVSNYEGSGAAGLFQFMPGTFGATPFGAAGLSVWSPYANALAAAWQVAHHGWGAWGGEP